MMKCERRLYFNGNHFVKQYRIVSNLVEAVVAYGLVSFVDAFPFVDTVETGTGRYDIFLMQELHHLLLLRCFTIIPLNR